MQAAVYQSNMAHRQLLPVLLGTVCLECAIVAQTPAFVQGSILDSLHSITESTIPSNGDVNPYGIAFVPTGFPSGRIAPGDVLVANFNDSGNFQGTGTTIVSITPKGKKSLFATSPLFGLDTALGVLSGGFVVVGNLPVTYPAGNPGQGSLQIFDANGNLVKTLNDSKLLDSPWDLTIDDHGSHAEIFVSNVLSGTVTRLVVSVGTQVNVTSKTRIGNGYAHAPNAAAVVVGPTGLAYNASNDTLYVASTADNEIFAINDAAARSGAADRGLLVLDDPKHLHGPLGLVLTPNGNLITANGDAVNPGGTQNDLVEFTPQGTVIATYQLDSGPAGGAFGIAIAVQNTINFAAVDDDLNSVTVWMVDPFF